MDKIMFAGSLEHINTDFSDEIAKLMNEKKWPELLQKEMYEEWVGRDASEYSIEFIRQLNLASPHPVSVSLLEMLDNEENLEFISAAPTDVVTHINNLWGLDIYPMPEREANPGRYFEYAKLSAETAKPGVMVNGELYFGAGRFIAALIRGDKSIKVWVLEGNKNNNLRAF